MQRDVKIINVDHTDAGIPDKKGIGWQLLTWLTQGYRLIRRDEVIGESDATDYTLLTFARENQHLNGIGRQ